MITFDSRVFGVPRPLDFARALRTSATGTLTLLEASTPRFLRDQEVDLGAGLVRQHAPAPVDAVALDPASGLL